MPQTSQPSTDQDVHRKRGLFNWVRNTLLAGVAVLFPVAVTVWFVKFVGYDLLDEPVRSVLAAAMKMVMGPKAHYADPENITIGIGIGLSIACIFVVGVLARSLLGRQLIRLAEFIVERVPLVRNIYNGLKQISDALLTKAGTESFRQAVLVKFMGEDAYAVGFVTGETRGEAQAVTPKRVMNVFVPTTPNPTSGYLLMVPADRLIKLQMTVEEALKMVISGGMVTPPPPPGIDIAPPPEETRTPVMKGDQA